MRDDPNDTHTVAAAEKRAEQQQRDAAKKQADALAKDEPKPETDIHKLSYPRHLHRGEEHCLVHNVDEAEKAMAEGYVVLYVSSDEKADKAKAAAVKRGDHRDTVDPTPVPPTVPVDEVIPPKPKSAPPAAEHGGKGNRF